MQGGICRNRTLKSFFFVGIVFVFVFACWRIDTHRKKSLAHLSRAYSTVSVQSAAETLGVTADSAIECKPS